MRARSDLGALVANDLEFHRTIGAACANGMLSALVESLSGPPELGIRAAEAGDPLGQRRPRYKRSDDSTVVFCRLDPAE
ncbi:MAG TPA: hypothetical protein VGX23_23345 [Actinocrinis sp.]|nr:hypothetical protein [Actinocrinis sp.]